MVLILFLGFHFTYFFVYYFIIFCRYSVILSKSNTDGRRAVIILGDKVGWVIFFSTLKLTVFIWKINSHSKSDRKIVFQVAFPALWWFESFCILSGAAQVLYSAQRENSYRLSQRDDCYSLPRAKLAVIKTSRLEHGNVICVTTCLSCLCVMSTLSKQILVWEHQ